MDMETIITGLSNLAPPVASLAIMAWIGKYVVGFLIETNTKTLEMFNKHGEALKSIENNMNAHTLVIKELGTNIAANTKMTEKISYVLEKKMR